MAKNYKSFEEVIEEVFSVFIENRLSLEEISETYNVDIEFLKVILNEDKLIVRNISKLLEATNIRLLTRKYPSKFFSFKKRKTYIEIKRNFAPLCTIKFNLIKKDWEQLKFKKGFKIKDPNIKSIVIDDFKEYKKRAIDKIYMR